MLLGWRRAFCTSISKNPEKDHQTPRNAENANPSPRIRSKFGFLSNPSTPRLRSEPVTATALGCRSSTTAAATTPSSSLPNSPRLQCRTTSNATPKKSTSPRFFSTFSNPSSPKSPSSAASLLKATLLLNKTGCIRCGVCLKSVKTGQGTAIFTAECSHVFHFPCIVALASKRCPVCASAWGDAPSRHMSLINNVGPDPKRRPQPGPKIREVKTGKPLRVYNDDEPLTSSPVSLALFNTIPESDENDDVNDDDEFPGFFPPNTSPFLLSSKLADPPISKNLEVKLLPESAVVAGGRRSETCAVVMRVKAPPHVAVSGVRRPSVDLVTVLDVSRGGKLQTVKQAMRLVISLLRETDRLSIVVFSSGSKRLLPLRRMTAEGRRMARRIVDVIVGSSGVGMSVNDALKKAVKVVEDRRDRNPSARILVLSDSRDNPAVMNGQFYATRLPFAVETTRISNLGIPVHSVRFSFAGALNDPSIQDSFTERVAGLLNVVMRDVRLQLGLVAGSSPSEITSVYSLSGRHESFESGSVTVGDLFAEEERELLVELKTPISSGGSNIVMSIRSSIVDPATLQPISTRERRLLIPRPRTIRTSSPSIERLRKLHVVSRAVAESRRLIQREDLAGAYRLLTSARCIASQAGAGPAYEMLSCLEAELTELSHMRMRNCSMAQTEEKAEPLTPTSAWRAAERLAKVAMMRKHVNRVSDLHGLEDARF